MKSGDLASQLHPTWTQQSLISQIRGTCGSVWTTHVHINTDSVDETTRWIAEVMASIDVLTTRFYFYDKMYSHELREQSFADWPFREECNCTPGKVRKHPVKSWFGKCFLKYYCFLVHFDSVVAKCF